VLVRDLMSRDFATARPDDDLATARSRLRSKQMHHLLVLEGEAVVGVVSMRDIAGRKDTMLVREVMTPEVATIDVGASLRRAATLMVRSTTGCLPVTVDGRVEGVITTSDLMRVLNADMTLS